MKNLLLILAIFCSVAATAQDFYGLGIDTATGRPGYRYLFRPLYTQNHISRVNDSTITDINLPDSIRRVGLNWQYQKYGQWITYGTDSVGVNFSDSLAHFIYAQTNGVRVVKFGLYDTVTTAMPQWSPAMEYRGYDSTTGGNKKLALFNYLQTITNTSTSQQHGRYVWEFDTSGVATNAKMYLWYNMTKNAGASSTLDFPNGGNITAGSNITSSLSFATNSDISYVNTSGQVSFKMTSVGPMCGSTFGHGFFFGDNTLHLAKYDRDEIYITNATLDGASGMLVAQGISLGTNTTVGAGKQFIVSGSTAPWGTTPAGGNLHNNGTISYTNGSASVTGVGTLFLSQFNVGDTLGYDADVSLQKKVVSVITDDTHLTLGANSTVTRSTRGDWYNYSLNGQNFFKVIYNGNIAVSRPFTTANFTGLSTTISAGTGAGTSPTVSVTGNDIAGYVTIATGSSPTASGDIVTITFSKQLMTTPKSIILTQANDNAAVELTKFYVDQASESTTSWKIKNSSVGALTGSTTYIFHYSISQ